MYRYTLIAAFATLAAIQPSSSSDVSPASLGATSKQPDFGVLNGGGLYKREDDNVIGNTGDSNGAGNSAQQGTANGDHSLYGVANLNSPLLAYKQPGAKSSHEHSHAEGATAYKCKRGGDDVSCNTGSSNGVGNSAQQGFANGDSSQYGVLNANAPLLEYDAPKSSVFTKCKRGQSGAECHHKRQMDLFTTSKTLLPGSKASDQRDSSNAVGSSHQQGTFEGKDSGDPLSLLTAGDGSASTADTKKNHLHHRRPLNCKRDGNCVNDNSGDSTGVGNSAQQGTFTGDNSPIGVINAKKSVLRRATDVEAPAGLANKDDHEYSILQL
ncbi:uncharacterized protein L969DRAFT_93505 [Mixia osmundae IAM 14324]|uniref:Uncharacterized protein n=1 Tax=Mixia osmundae (strain CBS 9802 / IAM 14324 / JCM 22182 / KY 12970) TaxID=764103 RepID=G7DU62_MIXOS|nr:uncharacterized protein L969DRAFT_93505 [Mixia osmundae IAM 14324]KEI40989.1 hypothetical protein L969DRAFT_93505 [Mixia osmundae IAM 14324]GAA94122.1 hypothetical protein E5Q_00770 [Mixia osmundae IAM 14324]